ncbi:MAG TPA: TatD family hydrolase [Planctomycetaceae bacterium]|nr:TatD family hydrolase [Planctomycetaceae bacterium]
MSFRRKLRSMIDTHCHLDAEAFHQEIDAVIQRALDAGVERMLTVGTTLESSQAAIVLSNRFPSVSAIIGIHPNYAQSANPGDWESIEELATHPSVVGVGETGLDKYWDHTPLDLQKEYFVRHIELSKRIGKPFVVHCREADVEVLEVLRTEHERGPFAGVMHAFSGNAQMAADCLQLGMSLSFAGMLTFRKNEEMRVVAATVPLDRLLVETDAPYLAPHPNRGKRNEPAWVRLTCECLATAHGLTVEAMDQQTTVNAMQMFRLS